MRVAALILAAGRSTRMGANKMCATLHGKALVRHVAEAALTSRAQSTLIVTGHEPQRVKQMLTGLALSFVHNIAYADGLASSLKAGVAALPPDVSAALVLLGDMPLVSPFAMNALIEAHEAAPDKAAIVPVVDGEWGNPVLIGRQLFPLIKTLHGDRGARSLLQANRGRVLELPLSDPALLIDIDTPETLRRIGGSASEKKGPA